MKVTMLNDEALESITGGNQLGLDFKGVRPILAAVTLGASELKFKMYYDSHGIDVNYLTHKQASALLSVGVPDSAIVEAKEATDAGKRAQEDLWRFRNPSLVW